MSGTNIRIGSGGPQTSGTWDYGLTTAGLVLEAFDRIQLRPTQLEPHHFASARQSINLELMDWSNEGFNFWETAAGTIPLVANQATYTLPTNLVTITEMYFSQVNAGGAGVNQDRIMIPITRTQYAQIVNKLQQGIPTQYWLQMLYVPQITIWEVPQAGQVAPGYVLGWYGLQQIQDANIGGVEAPDVHYRALDALAARLTFRLAEKFLPFALPTRAAVMQEKKGLAEEAFNKMARRDQEPGVTTIRANISAYGRI